MPHKGYMYGLDEVSLITARLKKAAKAAKDNSNVPVLLEIDRTWGELAEIMGYGPAELDLLRPE